MRNRTHELNLINQRFKTKGLTNYEMHKNIEDIYTIYYGFIFYSKSLNIVYCEYIKRLYENNKRTIF